MEWKWFLRPRPTGEYHKRQQSDGSIGSFSKARVELHRLECDHGVTDKSREKIAGR